MKYIDADKLLALIDAKIQELGLSGSTWAGRSVLHDLRSDIASLQQENEIIEFSFKGGTYKVDGEEKSFNGGKAKVIVLEINKEEENV